MRALELDMLLPMPATMMASAAFAALFAVCAVVISFVIRRLVCHPLAKYPGPKLAALTSLYEDYFEIQGNYDYVWQIKKLHLRYGPVIRINPHELHIDDPDWYSTLNSFKGKWDKDPHTALLFANPYASVGTVDHELHKRRKAAIQPFFAKQKIYDLEPVVVSKALQLRHRLLDEYKEDSRVIPMRQALKCFCVDTIAEYCFAKSGNMVQKPGFAVEYWQNFARGLDAGARARYLPSWFVPTIKVAPAWIRASVGPGIEYFELWHKDVEESVDYIQSKAVESAETVIPHRTIFHQLLNSDQLSPEDKARPRLIQEAGALIGAGGETTSQILALVLYGLLSDKQRLVTLQQELETLVSAIKSAKPQIPPLRKLEGLPYLTGCIKEGLRLRTGKIARQQRVPIGRSIYYKDTEIKAGTICSMTPIFCQLDDTVFPDPHSFRPERWIGLSEDQRSRMESRLVAFSKGTRMCTGTTLANAMLYIGIAALTLRFDMDLYQTTAWDIEMAVDDEKHSPLRDSNGLRVTLGRGSRLDSD